MDFIHVEGTQTEKPLEFDATTSKTIVYIRKNIERVTKTQDGTTYEVWEYDEAQLPMNDFNSIASALVSEQCEAIKAVTPATLTKTAYIDDTEVVFDNVPQGNVSVYMVDSEGQNVQFTYEMSDRQIRVMFDERQSLATVTVSII